MSCDIRRSALLTWILIVICMIVFCGSAAYLLLYGQNKISAEKEFNQMRKSFRDLSGLYAQNSDLVGWIRVDGTRIDYPVMQTPDNPEYYLHRDFNKEYSDSGTPFLDANSRIGGTWNWIIYGHTGIRKGRGQNDHNILCGLLLCIQSTVPCSRNGY